MKVLGLLVLIAVIHIAFLFSSYGTGLFGLGPSLPYMAVIAIWLGVSSVLAGLAYFKVGSRWPRLSSPALSVPFALAATLVSLYAGVFLAFNTFGT